MKKSIETILTEAAALVRRGWTKGALARDADGDPVPSEIDGACQWCAVGAIGRATGMDFAAADRAVEVMAAVLRGPAYSYDSSGVVADMLVVTQWNDQNGQKAERVAQALERAARRAAD